MSKQDSLKNYLSKSNAAILGGGFLRKKGSGLMSWNARAYFIKDDRTLLYFDHVANLPKGFCDVSEVSLAVGPTKNISKSGCRSSNGVSILMTLMQDSRVMPIVFDEVEEAKKFCVLLAFHCSTNVGSFASEMIWTDITTLLKERTTLLDEEKVGYFRSTAKSPEEVRLENEVLENDLAALRGRMATLDSEVDACDYESSSVVEVLKEPYIRAKNQLIRPLINNKLLFLEYKINSNRRFLGHKAPTNTISEDNGATPGRPLPISQSQSASVRANDEDRSLPFSQVSTTNSGTTSVTSSLFPRASPLPSHGLYSPAPSPKLQKWREEIFSFTKTSLDTMRVIIPDDILSISTVEALRRKHPRLPAEVASRLMTKRCLWILCLDRMEIELLDDSLLVGVYNTKGQNLDLVETASIYAIIPKEFFSTVISSAARVEWAIRVQKKLHHMLKERDAGTMPTYRLRCPVYNNVLPTGENADHSRAKRRERGSSVSKDVIDWGGDEDRDNDDDESASSTEDILQRVSSITPFGGGSIVDRRSSSPSATVRPTISTSSLPACETETATPPLSSSSKSDGGNRSRKRSLFSRSRALPSHAAMRAARSSSGKSPVDSIGVSKKKIIKHAEI